MEDALKSKIQPGIPPTRQLKSIVDYLLYSLLAGSVKRGNLIINDVPAGLPTAADENYIAFILGKLLSEVVNHTENDCIRISVSKNGMHTLISLKNPKLSCDKSFGLCLQTIQVIAQEMGGVIKIDEQENNKTVLAISFNRNNKAA